MQRPLGLALALTLTATFGCQVADDSAPANRGAGHGGSADAGTNPDLDPDAARPSDFLEVTALMRAGSVRVDKVRYLSDGLRVFGIICRPVDGVKRPVLVVNHGGLEGIAASELQDGGMCVTAARNGYVVIEAGYRGEPLFPGTTTDMSEGNIEFCLGEVNDVQNLMHIVRNQPYADAERFAAFGASHGGCITQQLVVRDPTLRAAVDFFGPSDLSVQRDWWQTQLSDGETAAICPDPATCESVHNTLLAVAAQVTGGTPSSQPDAYAARSPNRRLDILSVPMLFIHGTDDYVVNVEQTCLKRATLTAAGLAPAAWHLMDDLSPSNPPDVCQGGFNTTPAPDPTTTDPWSEQRAIVLIYRGQGHDFSPNSLATQHAGAMAASFLAAHLE